MGSQMSAPDWFSRVLAALPERDVRPLRGEADYYGASDAIAQALNLPETPAPGAPWSHGWRYNPLKFAASYTWSVPGDWERTPFLVHREDEAAFLRAAGVARAVAVGAPFLHLPAASVERVPDSLLIVPYHTLDDTRQRWEDAEYWRQLDPLLGRFRHVAACIHPSCLKKGLWLESLRARGIPFVEGASSLDRNALRRIQALFSSFSHVTSNWIGSHVVYAATSGCSVSIHGPSPVFRREDYVDEPFYRQFPEVLDYDCALFEEGYVRREFSFLFREPGEPHDDAAWAARQLGAESMRSPEEIARWLGWQASREWDTASFLAIVPRLGWPIPDPRVAELETRLAATIAQRDEHLARLAENHAASLGKQAERLTRMKEQVLSAREENERLRGIVERTRQELDATLSRRVRKAVGRVLGRDADNARK